MHPATTVTLIDGVRVVVPDSLDLITPCVLQEQQDWFEDEIKFLRRPRDALGDWIVAATLEEFERAGSYSSFYTGVAARQRLEIIRELGYGSAEMQRRLSLLQRRFGLPAS